MNGAQQPEVRARPGLLKDRPWAAVVLLMVVLILNQTDRLLPAILAEPLKRDLGLSDTFLGIINGIGFLAVYAVAAIPISRISDRGYYGSVITASLTLWSAMTALASLAGTSTMLAATRLGVAVGEAGCVPSAQAFVSRTFPAELRAKALALLTMGIALGSMLALLGGGLLAQAIGWRGTFLVMGLAGLVLSPVVYLALGPGQNTMRDATAPGALGAIRHLGKPTAIALALAAAMIGMGGNASAAFASAFLMRVHGLSLGEVAVQLGLISGLGGVIGLIGVSWLGARLSGRDPRWGLWLLAIFLIVSAPIGFTAWTVENPQLAIVLIVSSTLSGAVYIPLTVAALHGVVPASARAQASAVLLFASSVAGGLGPLIVGMISDSLESTYGIAALGRALFLVPVTLLLASAFYLLASVTLRRDTLPE